MSTNSDGSLYTGANGPKQVRRFQTGVRTLIVLVACCGAILWAWRHLTENHDPVLVEVRSIQKQAIGLLKSGKTAERVTAIQELERLHSGNSAIAIPPLTVALEDPETEVRMAAATALGSIGSSEVKLGKGGETIRAAAMALIRGLKDSEPTVRLAFVKALGSIGFVVAESGSDGAIVRDAGTALIGCSKDPEPSVRSAAATSLGWIGSARLAFMATSPIDRKAVINALEVILDDPDVKVRLAAIRAMASPNFQTDPPTALGKGLKDESAANRAEAVGGLNFFRQGLDRWLPVVLRLAEQDPDLSVRKQCLTTLSFAFKPPAVTAAVVPVLAASLKSKDAKVRSQVASLLGELGADARSAVPELVRILNEPVDPQVEPVRGPSMNLDPSSSAAAALGRIAPGSAEAKEVIAALVEVARSGPLSRRGWAAVALGEFGPAAQEAIPVLIKVIDDATPDDTFERGASAAVSLGKIAPDTPSAEQAVAALLPGLQSKNWLFQVRAIEALGHFGPRAAAAIPRLRSLKDDRHAPTDAAAKALLAIENLGAP